MTEKKGTSNFLNLNNRLLWFKFGLKYKQNECKHSGNTAKRGNLLTVRLSRVARVCP